ncbi:unnamed protein product [Lupinus luteus]|uniref:1-phosphatidylinositol-4-phosphate 5-kinase n=1 Tax=Lupinus luteus TaxID=3873 RepID=A0AAV1YMI6_LUPLU
MMPFGSSHPPEKWKLLTNDDRYMIKTMKKAEVKKPTLPDGSILRAKLPGRLTKGLQNEAYLKHNDARLSSRAMIT